MNYKIIEKLKIISIIINLLDICRNRIVTNWNNKIFKNLNYAF